jgi:hypothetical protein
MREARARAQALRPLLLGRVVILVGRKVGDAFNHPADYFVWVEDGARMVCVPHPSGRNLLYNDPEVRERLRALLQSVVCLDSVEQYRQRILSNHRQDHRMVAMEGAVA